MSHQSYKQRSKQKPSQLVTNNDSNSSLTRLIDHNERANKPIGIRLFGACFAFQSSTSKRAYHRALVLLLTFIAYTAFHMSRRPLSVVKNVLNRDCSRVRPHNLTGATLAEAASFIFISHQHAPQLDPTAAPTPNSFDQFDYDYQLAPVLTSTTMSPLQQQQHQHQSTSTNRPSALVSSAPTLSSLLANSTPAPKDTSCDWAPFNDDATANRLLAVLDTSFLLSYAIFMFVSGVVAERTNLRYFISLGSLVSGLSLIAFGLSYSLDIHSMGYFVAVQIILGAAQTTGWPVVVTCVSNWFDRAKLGTIYGLWNSHTNLGNILGATIAGYFVESDWGLSFIVPGALMLLVGLILFLFLVPTPADVQLEPHKALAQQHDQQQQQQLSNGTDKRQARSDSLSSIESPQGSTGGDHNKQLQQQQQQQQSQQLESNKPISFTRALRIPGVIEYSFCLFFSKLVSYTFLYWLPRYITSSTKLNSQDSAYLSTPFDVGGILGSVAAGWLSDRFKSNALICNIMLMLAIPSMFAYQKFGALSNGHNIALQLLTGSLVNGPYCLITTAVSADLGNRIRDGHAMATVSAIIDGMGSLGAVLGPLFAGFVSGSDWRSVFLMLMLADVLASLCIARVTVQELRAKLLGSQQSQQQQDQQA